jgi:glycosyltransferase involved in cell wall biosynthesis
MTKKKVAILSIDPRNKGGVLSSLQALYRFLEQKYEVTVFFLNFRAPFATSFRKLKFSSTDSSFTFFGMNCFGIGARFAFWEPSHYTNTLSSWQKYLEGYDLFFVSSGTPFAAHPLQLLKKKFILWVATPFWKDRCDRIAAESWYEKVMSWLTKSWLTRIEKDILESATVILPMSKYAEEEFVSILSKKKEMVVCPYPIDLSSVIQNGRGDSPRASTTNECTVEKDYSKRIVVAVGRFSDPRKNVDMLLHAWNLIEQEVSDAILLIIGQVTPATKKIIQKSATIYLAENVTNAKKLELYEKCSLALITSWQEGLGIVGLEALSYKVPIVSTDCGGVRDFVVSGVTGELVPCNDHKAMAKATIKLLQAKDVLEAMGEAGAKLIAEKFTIQIVQACWERVLHENSLS